MHKVPVVSAENALTRGKKPIAVAIGFSARALAQALSDTGFRVITVDAFGDCDTTENSLQSHILTDWGSPNAELLLQPHRWSSQQPAWLDWQCSLALPIFWGGGCENWPALQMYLSSSSHCNILGPNPAQFRQLRCLELWKRAAEHSGMRLPQLVYPGEAMDPRSDWSSLPRTGSWLRKSLLSAGGLSVSRLELPFEEVVSAPQAMGDVQQRLSDGHYLQQEITGRVLGAVCVAEWKGRHSGGFSGKKLTTSETVSGPHIRYLGTTESWQAEDWYGPTEFIYRGSWGPIALTEAQQTQVVEAARWLAQETGVTGWLQIDFIEDKDGKLWFLEVNPRWSAGMEILHRSGLVNPATEHAKAWGLTPGSTGLCSIPRAHFSNYIGKAIVYSRRDILAQADTLRRLQALPRDRFADIPSSYNIGQELHAGQPLLTVLASFSASDSPAEARGQILTRLRAAANELDLLESH